MGMMHDAFAAAEGAAETIANGIKDAVHDAEDFVRHELEELVQHSALAGNILPVLSKLLITPDKARLIYKNVQQVTQWQDLVLIGLLGWALPPAMNRIYTNHGAEEGAIVPTHKSAAYHVTELLSEVSKIAALVYVVDVLKIVLMCLGFQFPHLTGLPQAFAKVAYTLWMAKKIAVYKKHLLLQYLLKNSNRHDQLGRVKVVNRLANAVILALTGFFIMDILSVEMGVAGKSIFAFGSVSTLVVSLASQGLASQVLNGLMLSASDRIYEGDAVRFGNGIGGTVVKMGWMETILRGPDEIMLSVPNSDLASQRVSNLSRIHQCQVKQTLRFQYDDVDKLPQLVKDIKKEIRLGCPAVIVDGTRPFRVHWTDFNEDHLEVVVDAHFNVKPVGDVYWDNRQEVLLAINRAVKKHGLKFAIASAG